VKAGDLLIELDPRDFEARLSEARAALQVAEARERSAQATADHTSVAAQGDLEEASSVVNASKAALENARAQVTGASEREQRARSAVKAAEAAAQQAKAQIAAAEAEAVRASDDVKRYQRLYVQGVVSRQQWDQATAISKMADARRAAELEQRSAAQAQVDMARAGASNAVAERRQAESQLRQAQAQLRLARGRLTGAFTGGPHQVKASQEQASSLSGSVEQARANVTAAELRFGHTKIFAPVSGRVTGKLVQVGNYVGEGQELMAIVRQDFYVTANYKETQLRFMRPGQQVYVSIDSFPGKVYRGHVDSIQCGSGSVFSLLPPENAAGNFVKVVQRFPVKIVFDEPLDPSLPIGPGMSVQPEVRVR
jgi:membrane fusion protein (multidrug efflux system)